MPIQQLDPDKCRQRNRIAARRDGVDAVPVRLFSEAPETTEELLAHGRLPLKRSEVLASINAAQPAGAERLTEDDVFVHYAEAANGNFISDRSMFLDLTTLKNISTDGVRGVAFMNSHRTGGLSHDSELPFGRTFGGRFEQDGPRTILGIYMLARNADGEPYRPNGANGPSTADLSAGINAGTVFDVSVGLYGGDRVCDVCGMDLLGYDENGNNLCPHMPGTTYGMTPQEQNAQKKRGVPKGNCSYTLVNARLGEISAVFDGAVPGAGFRKALSLSASGAVGAEFLAQARDAYSTVLGRHDFQDVKQHPERVQELAAGLLAMLDGEEGLPDGQSFEAQLETALAAVRGCIERGEGLQSLRAAEGRSLSLERRAQIETLQAALADLCRPGARERLHALRRKSLDLKIGALSI